MLHFWNVLFGDICFNEGKIPVTLLSFPLPSLKSLVDMCYFFLSLSLVGCYAMSYG